MERDSIRRGHGKEEHPDCFSRWNDPDHRQSVSPLQLPESGPGLRVELSSDRPAHDRTELDLRRVVGGGHIVFLQIVQTGIGKDRDIRFRGAQVVRFEGSESLIADEELAAGREGVDGCLLVFSEYLDARRVVVQKFFPVLNGLRLYNMVKYDCVKKTTRFCRSV